MPTDCLKELLGGSNCIGTCTYQWQNGNYVYYSGSCSGGTQCHPCPATIDPTNSVILRGLVYALGPACYPDPDNITASCGINYTSLPGQLVPILKRLRLCKLLAWLSAALGVLSCISLGGLVYMLFHR
jgi:hypothetical protein